MKHLGILGAGGHARSMSSLFENNNELVLSGFFDDNPTAKLSGVKNLGLTNRITEVSEKLDGLILALGNNHKRKKLYGQLKDVIDIPTISHFTSYISVSAKIGNANQILPRVVVNPYSETGDNCILNTNVTIEHDVSIGNHVNISPNTTILGAATIGDCVFIGSGSVIREGVSVKENTVIGMGSIITKDVGSNLLVYGNPGKVIRTITSDYQYFST